ncbi:secreted antigen 1 [Babesia caballi]|uniref:Secreted antigen 1 n=1 Tax=Babesia caballi TaxID=5871 RepID=A0AAV4LMI2_BABCB|nr:secreted antigen 1 [Babesia caballi]
MSDCWGLYSEFYTLKECLDYVAWLQSQNNIEKHISTTIGNALEKYIQKGHALPSNVTNLLNALVELRNVIVKDESNYGALTNKQFGEQCDGGHIYNLSISLCRIYGALLFLWFNTSESEKERGRGEWSTLSCQGDNNELCNWLTSPHTSGSGLLAGGFDKDDLNVPNGKQIANKVKNQLASNGDLQKCVDILLFLPPWLHEKTAVACVLLKQLCNEISNDGTENKLPGEYADDYEEIKIICTNLKLPFSKIIKENGDGFLSVAYNGSKDLSPYNVKEHFRECIGFLKGCLPDLIGSLEHMKEQCIDWTAENIKNATTPGPFLYGFSFTDKCKPTSEWSTTQAELRQAISQVVQSLNELNEILNPPSHAVAIGLGVVSTVLVGGSAAAAYFYPGLLSSTIHMIVG